MSLVLIRKALGSTGPNLTLPVIQSFTASSSSITAGQSTILSVTATDATQYLLNGTVTTFPATVTPSATTLYTLVATGPGGSATTSLIVSVTPVAPSTPSYKGFYEHVSNTGCNGWVADVNNVSNKLTVSVRLNGTEVTQVVANVFRQDVANAGYGDGYSAFTATWTTPTTPGTYTVTCVALGTGFTLTGLGNINFTVQPSGGGGPPVTGTGGSGSFALRSAGAVYARAFTSQADLGRNFNTDSAPYRTGSESTSYQPNAYGVAPTYDSVVGAVKFTIPANNLDASGSGLLYIRYPHMPTAGNGSYWFQFRVRFDQNYMNTVFQNADGSLQEGLKLYTAGPAPDSQALPFGGTNVWGKLVHTSIYGYRFLTMYKKDGRFLDSNTFVTHYQTEYPACSYSSNGDGVQLGSPTYPPPTATPCKNLVPDQWITILVNLATGPRVTNPRYLVGADFIPEVFQNTTIRWWRHLEGESAYTLVHSWGPGSENYSDFNAMEPIGDISNGQWIQSSMAQHAFEMYTTLKDNFAGMKPPGVDSTMWLKEFIVQSKSSALAPEVAIPIPTPDSPINPTWTHGLPYEQPVELGNSQMGALAAYEGPSYHPWNTAANNPYAGKQRIYDQDGLNAWGPLAFDDVNTRVLYMNSSGHSGARVQKTSVEVGDFSLNTPTWGAPLNPSADFSEAAGIAHGEPRTDISPDNANPLLYGVNTCRSSHYDNGDPAAQHAFNQLIAVMPMLEGPRVVMPTNSAATYQTESNHPAPSNNAYRVNQRAWCAFGKDANGVRRASVIDYIGGATMSNFSSSAHVPGTQTGYVCVPNSNTQYLFKYVENEDRSCTITGISSSALLVKTEGAGMFIDPLRDRICFTFNYVDSTTAHPYMIVGENLSSGSPTFRSVEITGPGASHIYVPSVNPMQKMESGVHSLANDTYYFLQSVTFDLVAVTPPSSVATTTTSRYICTMPFPTGNTSGNINQQFHYFPRPRTLVYIGQFFRGPIVISTDPNRT